MASRSDTEVIELVRCMNCGAFDFTDDALRSPRRGDRCADGDVHGPTEVVECVLRGDHFRLWRAEYDRAEPLDADVRRLTSERTRLESEVTLYRAALEAILAPHGQDLSDRIRDIAESALNGGETSVEN